MHLTIGLAPALTPDLTTDGDMVGPLFHRTAALLAEDGVEDALRAVAPAATLRRYRDLIDFLFCELVGAGWHCRCVRYYTGRAPKLAATPGITAAQVAEWDVFLASALVVAREAAAQGQAMSWPELHATTVALLAATALDGAA